MDALGYSADDIDRICSHSNERKSSARQASEYCDKSYALIYLRRHPEVKHFLVMEVGVKSFTLLEETCGWHKRLYADKVGAQG